jgi:CTP:molybdopterin cytidylyltransferase MocA
LAERIKAKLFVVPDEKRELCNINTLEDWRRLLTIA